MHVLVSTTVKLNGAGIGLLDQRGPTSPDPERYFNAEGAWQQG
jgi:hypothetical protein